MQMQCNCVQTIRRRDNKNETKPKKYKKRKQRNKKRDKNRFFCFFVLSERKQRFERTSNIEHCILENSLKKKKMSRQLDLQEKNKQTLQNITRLQQEEQQLYAQLENSGNSGSPLTETQRQQLIQRVNELSQMRINMYSMLSNMVSSAENNVQASNQTVQQSMDAIDVLETELNRTKQRINRLQTEKNNQERLVEINTYYGKRYTSHVNVMKTVVVMFSVICVAHLALPAFVSGVLIRAVWLVGVCVVGYQLMDIWYRDNVNWDEYNWYFNKNNAPALSTTDATSIAASSDPWSSSSSSSSSLTDTSTSTGTCVGANCCSGGSHFDEQQQLCVL